MKSLTDALIMLSVTMVAKSLMIPEHIITLGKVTMPKSQISTRPLHIEQNQSTEQTLAQDKDEIEVEDSEENGTDYEDDSEQVEEDGGGTGGGNNQQEQRVYRRKREAPRAGNRRKPGRQMFNSAMGIGIDAPMSQPQTNAYDVHSIHHASSPWESSNSNNDENYYYYYYYYYDEDYDQDENVPLPKQKSERQSLNPNVGRIISAMLKRNR